uniref:Uncharacterized protein n=1 Tax=Aplanochytrium stocchinoi TaxID=215587 RepID=A0A7S3PQ37_9STRA|mmetsp:Transcript_3541/g.4445  ORF Transcript_3541/g.4445 Transcript_3541/m.4445 type:complete len:260 (-) Transcript_3541:546-1325(-)|eukprot:CAMPEP_0204828812 /NCGR_PEP_ID=MMETSP1346-20131115/6739_1 /ASSEMBLY_ACC=CAM_ASM_000771 /TAXON_ID=215587 /ORGANISM="Aplanochytrium stocchinoi, Strain GSBS06" /LENGTH=259 /DNA_ID=CAMNT_0051958145 /DNA_START=347 /DNA_END=1126 /DNA_ORIENTATION=-
MIPLNSLLFAIAVVMVQLANSNLAVADLNLRSLHGGGEKLKFWCKWNPSWCIQCPKVTPIDDFDLDKYIEKSWYVQKQQVNPYQAENELYCVTATYSRQNDSDLIVVNNYANDGAVNGPTIGTGTQSIFSNLCAKQKEVGTGNLAVAPCFFDKLRLFDLVAGPYWVVSIDEKNYSWAIVSGGQPKVVKQEDPTLCTTKEGNSFLDTNGSGLWLFTREPQADPETISMMENKLTELGFYTGDLKNVSQAGCTYNGANLKA